MRSRWMVVLMVALAGAPGELWARGGRGGSGGVGGGARGGGNVGGGGARGGGNFGGGARGGGGMSHAPSFSRPSGMGGAGGGERFGGGGGVSARPAGGGGGMAAGTRPGGGGAGFNNRAEGGGAAGAGNRSFEGNRANTGNFNGRNDNFANRNLNNDNFGNRNVNSGNFTNRNFNNDNFANRNLSNNNFNNNNFTNRNFSNNNFSNNNLTVNRGAQYGGWYHGDWHGNAGWNAGGYRPWGWGWGGSGFGWGLGAGLATVGLVAAVSPWNWGYYGYSNPYWNGGGGNAYINYSQPIVAAAPYYPNQQLLADGGPAPAPGPATPQDQAIAIFDGARGQFTAGDYAGALAAIDNAIQLVPNDSVMHEFRALCLFAEGDYQQSAAAVYAVLSGGPGWDWTTVSSLYPSVTVYTQQLRALEKYSDAHPDAADAKFLLAYQYLLTGYNDAAGTELKQVVALQPKDTLSAQLLKSISPTADATATATAAATADAPAPATAPAPAAAPAPAGKPVDVMTLVGDWTASRPDGSKVEMDLTPGKEFTWRFAQGGKPQELTGTYTLADNYLVLKASQQNALVGEVGLLANNQLSFRLADDNPADPGLVFNK